MKNITIRLFTAVNGEDGFKLSKRAARVAPGEFPFLVSIQINGQHTCGGSLISLQHVLTAGHCVEGQINQPNRLFTEMITVEVGSVQLGAGKSHNVIRLSRKKDAHANTHVNNQLSPDDIGVITVSYLLDWPGDHRIFGLPIPLKVSRVVFANTTRRCGICSRSI